MTRVAFVRLEKAEKARHCCLLAEKHFLKGERVLIVVRDREQEEQLDTFVWNWPKSSFIPHILVDEKNQNTDEPVLIAIGCRRDFGAEVLIMAHPCPIEFIRRFPTSYDFAEIHDPRLQEDSRRRFALYREAGLDPFMYQ